MVLSHRGYYTVAEPVEAQTTKANKHDPGAGADLQSVPTKDHLFR
jgi:hypothetical protein